MGYVSSHFGHHQDSFVDSRAKDMSHFSLLTFLLLLSSPCSGIVLFVILLCVPVSFLPCQTLPSSSFFFFICPGVFFSFPLPPFLNLSHRQIQIQRDKKSKRIELSGMNEKRAWRSSPGAGISVSGSPSESNFWVLVLMISLFLAFASSCVSFYLFSSLLSNDRQTERTSRWSGFAYLCKSEEGRNHYQSPAVLDKNPVREWRVMREEEWGKKNRSRVSTRRGKHPRTDIFFGQKRGKGGNSYPWNRSHRIKTKREGKKDEDISVRRDRRSVTDGILFETGIRTWTNVEDGLINWWLGWYRMCEREIERKREKIQRIRRQDSLREI